MRIEHYLSILDELTDLERSVFLYYCVLKIPYKEIPSHLKIPVKTVKKACETLEQQKVFVELTEELYQSFLSENR